MNTNSVKVPIIILFTFWFTALLLLRLLQYFHLGMGFNVWPMDEDRVWIGLMKTYPNKQMLQAFWAINDRNPLSAWWWYSLKPLISRSEYWLYFTRKCIDLFLGITTFLLLDRLGKRQCRTFAFCTALIVLFWNFNSYYNQIIWDFLGALGFSLLSIFFYCRYIDNRRLTGHDLALALICYFIAISTYTLQCGAIISIAALAFFRDVDNQTYIRRSWNTIKDVSFFVAIFSIYNCIWQTTSRNSDVFYVLHWDLFIKQFTNSVSAFLYHPSYTSMLRYIISDWSPLVIILSLLSAFFLFSFILFNYPDKKIGVKKINFPSGAIFYLLLAISVPIIILEATSQIWFPGTRSLMVEQVWQPILYVTIISILVNLLPKRFSNLTHSLFICLISTLAAVVFIIGLNYNYRLNLRTQYQKNLVDGIHSLHIDEIKVPYVLVRITNPTNNDINSISPFINNYMAAILHEKRINVRIIPNTQEPGHEPYWTINFASDATGIINAGPLGDVHAKPYNKVLIVFFDGNHVWVPKELNKNDFSGLYIQWHRSTPIQQTEKNFLKFNAWSKS